MILKKTILLVEDEGIIALNIKEELENLDYHVPLIVTTGEEAVKQAAKLRPDLVLLDIILKGQMDGIEAASKIMALNIPVIYITAHTDENTIKRAIKTPSSGYIVKPYGENELKNKIEIALHKFQMDQAKVELVKEDITLKKLKVKINKTQLKGLKPRIMVVEDEGITAMDLAGKLEDLGYRTVAIVSSGNEAIEKARKLHPDLILMDIVLKGDKDGINVAEILKNMYIPVVYLTAHGSEQILKRASETSPYGYIIKPYRENELKTTIEMALHKHQKDQEMIGSVAETMTIKEDELKIEKIGVLITSAVMIVVVMFGIITRNMTWLEYLLFFTGGYGLILTIVSMFKTKVPKPDPKSKLLKPFVSIIIPAHNEENTIEKCVHSLAKIDYTVMEKKNYEIVVVNDGSTDNTNLILDDLENQFDFLKVVTRKPPRAGKGKGFVLNDGLKVCNGEIIAVFDADAMVKPDFLELIVPYLNEEGVGGVQARIKMYNEDKNVLTSMQGVEFSIFGNVLLKARDKIDGAAFLGGNGQLTRKDVIEELYGWDGYAITEDLNMSIKMMINGWKIRYCGEAEVYQEAVPNWGAFFRQRTRWAMGNLETLFTYFKAILQADISIFKRLDALYYLATLNFFNGFIMLAYIVFILNLLGTIHFSLDASIFIVILATISFVPPVIKGVWHDTRSITATCYQSVEYWVHCFYLLPLFFNVTYSLLTRHDRKWVKTHHIGESNELTVDETPILVNSPEKIIK